MNPTHLTFPCWSCGQNIKARPTDAGKRCKCKGCDEVNTIPGQAEPTAWAGQHPPVRTEAPVEAMPAAAYTPPPVAAPEPAPAHYQVTPPVPLGVRLFKKFVVLLIVLSTAGAGLMFFDTYRHDEREFFIKYQTFDRVKIQTIIIGGWITSMLVLGVVYLVAEMAVAAHKRK